MLWHCSAFMSQIQNQDLQGHDIYYISSFLTNIPLKKPNGTQDIQSFTVLELQGSKEFHEELQFLKPVHLQTT